MTIRLGYMCLMLVLSGSGCAEMSAGTPTKGGVSHATDQALEALKPYQRGWAIMQGAKPVREEFGSDCLVALNVYYTTAMTDHLLVLRNSAAMHVGEFARKRVALFDTVIHSRAGEPIDLPHQVRLAIQERAVGVAEFQRPYVGLGAVSAERMNLIEEHARADATEFRRQYGNVCQDTPLAHPDVSTGSP